MDTPDLENTTISLYGTVPDSIVDGPGLRYAVFVQGCSHGCPGCHNPDSQPAEGGKITSIEALLSDIRANGLVHDVTLSGGEPFEQPEACAVLAEQLKSEGYGIWCYTGYLYEDLEKRAASAAKQAELLDNALSASSGMAIADADLDANLAVGRLLDHIDVLVDGPFIESLKSLGLSWCGSSNQRLIDLPATRKAGRIVLWESPTFTLEKPSNW